MSEHTARVLEALESNEKHWEAALRIKDVELLALRKSAKQTHRHSLRETITGLVIGFCISVVVMYFLLGLGVGPQDSIWMTLVFTVTSFIRGWCVRRGFNWYEHR